MKKGGARSRARRIRKVVGWSAQQTRYFGRANKTKFLGPYHAFYCAGIEGVGTDRQQFGISLIAMPIFVPFLFFIIFPNFDRQRHERLCDRYN